MAVVCKATARLMAILWVLLTVAVDATSQNKQTVSLQTLIDSAQRHLPELLQKQATADAARAAVTDARHSFLPGAVLGDQVSISSDNSLPGSYLSLGVIPSTSAGVRNDNTWQSATGNIAFINTEYEFINFGLKKALVNKAASYADLSQADVDREKYLLQWQVSKIYFHLLKNQYQLDIDRQNITRYDELYTVIRALTGSGIKAGVDSSLALAELSKARINYNQTEGALGQLTQQLAYLTGIASPRIAVDTSTAQRNLPSLAAPLPDTLAASNPLIDYYHKQQALYRNTEELVKKSYLPKVLLSGIGWARGSSIGYDNSYKALETGLGYQRYNYMAGVTLSYDLFSGIHRRDRLAVSRLNSMAGDYQLQQEEQSLDNVSNQARERMNMAYKNLYEIPIQVMAAQDAYNQKTAQYRAGIINLVDLTNASFVLYRAQSDYVQTLSDWLLANLDRAAATGHLNLFVKAVNQ